MVNLRNLPEFEASEPEVIESLESQLSVIETLIKSSGFTLDVLARLSALMRVIPAMGTDMCNRGEGVGPAPQWESTLEGVTYITCGHNPPHIRIKKTP